MINPDVRISASALRIISPHAVQRGDAVEAPADAVCLSGSTAAEAPAETPRRMHAVLLAGMMLPGVIGGILTATPALAQAAQPSLTTTVSLHDVKVENGDVLNVKVRQGDTYYKMARIYAANPADAHSIRLYANDLERVNGKGTLRIGQPLELPVTANAGPALRFVVAAQKEYGARFPDMAWQSARISAGPVESFKVSVPFASGAVQAFYVTPDLKGDRPNQYAVLSQQDAERLHPEIFGDVHTQEIAGDLVEDAGTFHVPPGSVKVVFGKNRVATYDADGKLNGLQRYPSRVLATTLHDHADVPHHALLTQNADGEIEVHLPDGTVRLQIDPSEMTPQQSKFNGSVYALDAEGRTLASQERSDIRIISPNADILAGATFANMLTQTRGSATITVPNGTRRLLINSSETRNDGSIIAFDGNGNAIQIHANWDGHADAKKPGSLVHYEKGQLYIHVLPGTQHVEIGRGAVKLVDARGAVIAQQLDAGFEIGEGPL